MSETWAGGGYERGRPGDLRAIRVRMPPQPPHAPLIPLVTLQNSEYYPVGTCLAVKKSIRQAYFIHIPLPWVSFCMNCKRALEGLSNGTLTPDPYSENRGCRGPPCRG